MAIEIRPFEGNADELGAFVTANWRALYAKDGYAPTVTGDFFRWMMPIFAEGDARSIIAAYEGSALLGVMPSEPLDLMLQGEPVKAHWTEYSTVSHQRLGEGIGGMLRKGLARRSSEIGASFKISFINSDLISGKGRGFWTSSPERATLVHRPRPWLRLLNPAKVADSAQGLMTRVAAYAGGLISGPVRPVSNDGSVRRYRDTDFPQCYRIFRDYMRGFDLALDWGEARLRRHIAFSDRLPTFVYEAEGSITGFATCYVFEVTGQGAMGNAVIDAFILPGEPVARQVQLLQSAIANVHENGADLVMILGPPVNSREALIRLRFIPMQSTYDVLLYAFEPDPRLQTLQNVYAMFR